MMSKLPPLLAATALLALVVGRPATASVETETPPAHAEPPAAPAPELPPGVRQVMFGPPARSRTATGVPRCGIREPLPGPATFPAGVREVAWVALVDTSIVASLKGSVTGDPGGELALDPCEVYTVCGSGACRSQYGAVLRRKDGQPLRSGTYRLEIEAADRKVILPFAVASP